MAGTVERVEDAGGASVLVRHWVPAGDSFVRLLLVHGIAEHSGRYERTGSLMAAAGVDVHAFDLPGFGESGGRRAWVERWDEYLAAVEGRLDAIADGALPVALMGHSMGGLIAASYVASGRRRPDLLVLSSPALGSAVSPLLQRLAALASRVAPTVTQANPLGGKQLSRDPGVAAAYFGDPLLVPRTTMRLAAEMFAAMRRSGEGIGRIAVPTLVIHGSDDTIVPPAASEPLSALPNVERRVYPGLRHETLNEPEGPRVVADVVGWLRARVAERPRPA